MRLSLYLLLTPPLDSDASDKANAPIKKTTREYPAVMREIVWSGDTNGFPRHQASRCMPVPEAKHSLDVVKLGFAARVVFNALGFLLMTSSLLLLLQIAQASMN